MGKKGDALRAAKLQKTYTVTQQWLEDHDRQILEARAESLRAQVREEINKEIGERNEALIREKQDIAGSLIAMLTSVPARVLVRDFGWTPVRDDRRGHLTNLGKFCIAVRDEINNVVGVEKKQMQEYQQMVFEETGIICEFNEE